MKMKQKPFKRARHGWCLPLILAEGHRSPGTARAACVNVFQTKQKKLEASHFQWNPLNTSLGNRVKKELTVSTQLPLSLCLEDPTECITPVQGGQYPAPLKGRTLPTSLSSSFPLLLSVLPSPPLLLPIPVAPWPAKVPLRATVSPHRHFRVTANGKQTKVARTIVFIIKLHLEEQTRLYTEACNGTCQEVQYYTEKCVVTTD